MAVGVVYFEGLDRRELDQFFGSGPCFRAVACNTAGMWPEGSFWGTDRKIRVSIHTPGLHYVAYAFTVGKWDGWSTWTPRINRNCGHTTFLVAGLTPFTPIPPEVLDV